MIQTHLTSFSRTESQEHGILERSGRIHAFETQQCFPQVVRFTHTYKAALKILIFKRRGMEVVPRVVVKKFVVLLSICLTTPDLGPQNTDVGTSLTVNYGRRAPARRISLPNT
jgi:hypothetical protein